MDELASIERLLNLRLRPDLVAVEVEMATGQIWMVKDPLTLEHHQFTPQEYFLLDCLRKPTSLAKLCRDYEAKFSPERLSHEAVWKFLHRLHQSSIVVSTTPGQARELLAKRHQEQRHRWSFAWRQILAIRFRGIDPDRWLTAFHGKCRWLFSWPATALAGMLVLFAMTLVFGHFQEFWARLPDLGQLADFRNVGWLMLAIAVVKILHELGHAVACKHFGGEVHELGLLLLAFTPCLYCDVSDAWQLPDRRQRILISAAGMIVEFVLAALAVIVWWYSHPGILHLIALNIVLVCTVSTLAINANPLLRYDGYYILSDLTATPNLWQRSRQVLRQISAHWLLGLKDFEDVLVPKRHRGWLVLYAICSKLYLTLVLTGIVWMLVTFLHPLHLEVLAYGVGIAVVASAIWGPIVSTTRFLRNPLRRRQIGSRHMALILLLTVAAGLGLLMLPVPYHVDAPVVLMPEKAMRVYATVAGQLVNATPVGTTVKTGQPIAWLDNSEVAQNLAHLEGKKTLQTLQLEHLEALRGQDATASAKIPAAQTALASIQARLADVRQEANRLVLKAPQAGTVLPVPSIPQSSEQQNQLPTWSGTLLDTENLGALVEPGTLVCWVGDPNVLEAVLLVNDAEAQRIATGQEVRLELHERPRDVLHGQVVEVAQRDVGSNRLFQNEPTPLEQLSAGLTPPGGEATYFRIRVQFMDTPNGLLIGTRGQAKVTTTPMQLGRRILRWLAQTFRLPA